MNKEDYLIIGVVMVLAVGFYLWYSSKKEQAPQVLATPSNGSGSVNVSVGGSPSQSVPDSSASIFGKIQDLLSGIVAPKATSPTTSTVAASPVSNVIQTAPFTSPIVAPSDKSSAPVVNPTVIEKPDSSPISTPVISVPKTGFSAPLTPTTLVPTGGTPSGSPAGKDFFLKQAIKLGVVKILPVNVEPKVPIVQPAPSFEKSLFNDL